MSVCCRIAKAVTYQPVVTLRFGMTVPTLGLSPSAGLKSEGVAPSCFLPPAQRLRWPLASYALWWNIEVLQQGPFSGLAAAAHRPLAAAVRTLTWALNVSIAGCCCCCCCCAFSTSGWFQSRNYMQETTFLTLPSEMKH